MNVHKETITSARKLAAEVSKKMGLSLTETRAIMDSVVNAPKRSASIYRSILKSYNCPGCGKPE